MLPLPKTHVVREVEVGGRIYQVTDTLKTSVFGLLEVG